MSRFQIVCWVRFISVLSQCARNIEHTVPDEGADDDLLGGARHHLPPSGAEQAQGAPG